MLQNLGVDPALIAFMRYVRPRHSRKMWCAVAVGVPMHAAKGFVAATNCVCGRVDAVRLTANLDTEVLDILL